MQPWRDCGWRTRLGTCFYDRLREASTLERLARSGWSVVLAGPRNSGKSELARYVAVKRLGGRVIWVDAGRLAAGEKLGEAIESIGADLGDLAARLAEAVAEGLRLGELYRLAVRLAKLLAKPLYLVIDEVHLLAGVEALEAVAKEAMLSRRVTLIATSSEGYMLEARVAARLAGYRVELLTVAEMDEASFNSLYEEYCSSTRRCRLGVSVIEVLAGRLPGYIGELADADMEVLRAWVYRRGEILDTALMAAAGETNTSYREVLETAYRLLVEERMAEHPREHLVAEALVRHNIAYPARPPRLYRPQLNVYRLLIRAMVEEQLDALEAAERVYEDVAQKHLGGGEG